MFAETPGVPTVINLSLRRHSNKWLLLPRQLSTGIAQ